MSQILAIPRFKDKALINCFNELAKTVENYSPRASISCFGSVSIAFDPSSPDTNADLAEVLAKDSELINTASFSSADFSATIYRGGKAEPKSPYTDEVHISINQNTNPKLSNIERLSLIHIFVKSLKSFTPGRMVGNITSKEQEELAAIHESTLSRLEHLSEKLIVDNHEYRKNLDNQFLGKFNALEKSQVDKEQELQNKHQKLIDELKIKETEFEEKQKALDSKSNTHARRQIRKDIIGEIKKRQTEFKLTNGTNELRLPIAISMIILIIIFLCLSAYSLLNLYQTISSTNTMAIWISAAKQIIYSFGLIGSVLFYIRWQNRWFEQHSLAEFHLKQLELDMERASWIVETSLEWNDAKGNTMPNELLKSLSKNLFSDSTEQAEGLVHPADQLASALMGSASLVKLKAGDAELEIDPKKLRKDKSEIKIT